MDQPCLLVSRCRPSAGRVRPISMPRPSGVSAEAVVSSPEATTRLAERVVQAAVVSRTRASDLTTGDGTRLAYSLDGKVCGQGKTLRFCPGARLTVVDLPAGTRKTVDFTVPRLTPMASAISASDRSR